jgi:hypothetical protein
VTFSAELRRELGLEQQPVRLYAYKGRIQVLSERLYEEQKRAAMTITENDIEEAEKADLM